MIGRTLRQYVVTEKLGQGGMGVVWKARDTSLHRDVALKVLSPDATDDPSNQERFLREARAASALNHPNIVAIYEINSDGGTDFIAMEYVSGATLAAILHGGRLEMSRLLGYAIQIADGVGRAHSAGIVHRDLKPGNIMVTDDGLVKVLDFGLAKVEVRGEVLTDAVTEWVLTRTGTTLGTVGYMSPEQAIGDAVDARSDVFSFGVILYQMITGAVPFQGPTQLQSFQNLHLADPAPIASLRPDAPPPLTAVVSRALAKKPNERYANLTEVAAQLRQVSVDERASSAFSLRKVWHALRRRRLALTRRTWVAGACAAAALLLAVAWRTAGFGGVAFLSPAMQTDSPYALSQQAATLLERDDRPENVDRAVTFLERALAQDGAYAPAHAQLAMAYLRRYQVSPDPQWLRGAREAARRAVEINTDLAVARVALGRVHLAAEARDDAQREFTRAVELDPASALAHLGLANTFAAGNQDERADTEFQAAVARGPKVWQSHMAFGQFLFRRARYADAATEWEAVRAITPDNVPALQNLGAAYYQLGRYDEAASAFQRALEIRPSAATYTNLGTLRFFQGRYADAVGAFEKAVDLGANTYLNWANLADGYRWAPGRRGEAAAAYRQASDILKEQIAKNPQDVDLLTRQAVYLVKMGERDAALMTIAAVAARPTLTPAAAYRLAMVYELAGDRVKALASIEKALSAGYSVKEIDNEPEFIALRADARYHRLLDRVAQAGGAAAGRPSPQSASTGRR